MRILRILVSTLIWLPLSVGAAPFDVLIENGTVYDGNGGAPYVADIALSGDRIAGIGDYASSQADKTVDATGLAVAPGFIRTDMTEVLNENVTNAILQQIPLKRLGESADIANMVAFLASNESGYITGQTFTVDGGMVM